MQLDNDMKTMNKQLFIQQQREIESLQKIKHEFKRHLLCLCDYSSDGQLEKIQSYCQEIINRIQASEKMQLLVDFKNFTISNIYSRFVLDCQKYNITYRSNITFRDLSFIKDIDATILFNNLFDNALEACKEIPHNSWIELDIHQEQRNIIIKLKNSMNHQIKIIDNKLMSTKRNYFSPGFGLGQILLVAEKYGGYASTNFKKEEFNTIIRIPIPENAL